LLRRWAKTEKGRSKGAKRFAVPAALLAGLFLVPATHASFSEEAVQHYRAVSVEKDRLNNAFLILQGEISLLGYRLKDYQIAQLDAAQLRLLRNTIFARHGYRFQSPELFAHFKRFCWYEPSDAFDASLLTEIDQYNIGRISCFENAYKSSDSADIDEKAIEGIWHRSPVVGSGYAERYFFHEDGGFKWCSNQMDGSTRLFAYRGRWELHRSMVEVTVTGYEWLEGGRIAAPYASYGSGYVIEDGRMETVDLSDDPPVMRFPVGNYGIDRDLSQTLASDIISMHINGRKFYKGRYE
jgi:hypothetical protein